jgi:hypothetical protein
MLGVSAALFALPVWLAVQAPGSVETDPPYLRFVFLAWLLTLSLWAALCALAALAVARWGDRVTPAVAVTGAATIAVAAITGAGSGMARWVSTLAAQGVEQWTRWAGAAAFPAALSTLVVLAWVVLTPRLFPAAGVGPRRAPLRVVSAGGGGLADPVALGARLVWRTTRTEIMSRMFFAVLVAALSLAVREEDGTLQAFMFGTGGIALVMLDFSRRARLPLGRQHRFLACQGTSLPRTDWRRLVAGESLVFSAMAAAGFALVAAFHVGTPAQFVFLRLALGGIALGFVLTALIHLTAPIGATDDWGRQVAFAGAAIVLTALWLGLTVFALASVPALVGQSALIAGVAVVAGARRPIRMINP